MNTNYTSLSIILTFLLFTLLPAQSFLKQITAIDSSNIKEECEQSLQRLNNAIKEEPDNPVFYLKRAQVEEKLELYDKAESDLNRAVHLNSTDPSFLYGRSLFLTNVGRYEEALKDINRCIQMDSTAGLFYLQRGNIFRRLKNNDSALRNYNKAIALDSTLYTVYVQRAQLYQALKNMDGLCYDTQKALSIIEEDSTGIDTSLIRFLREQNREFCDPRSVSYYYHRGMAAYKTYDYPQAVKIYERGLSSFKNNALFLSLLGNAYLQNNEYDKAIEAYEKSNHYSGNILPTVLAHPKLNPTPLTSYNYTEAVIASNFTGIAVACLQKKEFSAAKEAAAQAMNMAYRAGVYSIFIQGKIIEGEIFLAQNDFDEAGSIFRQVYRQDKSNPQIWESMARLKLAELLVPEIIDFEQYESMVDPHQKFKLFSTEHIVAVIRQSEINKKDLEEIIADCDAAIERDETFAPAYYLRALVKLILQKNNYCPDIKQAEKYGLKKAAMWLEVECP